MGPVTDQEIWQFSQKVQRLCDGAKLTNGCKVDVIYGKKNARIVQYWGGQTMAWGWVEKATGDVYRGSWKAPDKRYGPHTNINATDVDQKISWTGPAYKT